METSQVVVSKEEFDKLIDKLTSNRQNDYLIALKEYINKMAQKFQKWIEDLLMAKMGDPNGVKAISEPLSKIIMIIAILIVIVIIAVFIRYIYVCLHGEKGLKEILGEQITKDTTPYTLLEKASGYASSGDYRMGVRYSYISLLLLMHERHILYIEDTMTNREIYEALKDKEYDYLQHFKGVMEHFNYTWYGQNQYTGEAYAEYKKEQQIVWDEVMTHEIK